MSRDPEAAKDNKQHDGGEGSKKSEKWVKKRRDALMVVASLMATMAFQAGLTPPGGLWQDDSRSNSISPSADPSSQRLAGYSILFDKNKSSYDLYIAFNTTGYVASLSIILLLVSGLPFFTKKFFMVILTVVIWVAITAMGVTYFISIGTLTKSDTAFSATHVVLLVWGGLMFILIQCHLIRVLVWIIKFLVRMIRKLCRCCGSN